MRESGIRRPKRLAHALDELTRLADGGDVDAQYGLGRWLSECRRIHSGPKDFENAIARLRREGIAEDPETTDLPRGQFRVSDVATQEAAMRRHFAFCEGVSADRRMEGGNWLELAASSGSLLALHSLRNAFGTDNERGFQLNDRMWRDHGQIGALSALAIYWRKGWVPGGEPDYVRAYAYQFANLKLSEAVFANTAHPSRHRNLQAIEDSLSNLASYLTPQQTLEAEALGRRLLRENPNCCSSFFFGWTR